MKKIKGFPGYLYEDGIVYNPKGKQQKLILHSSGSKTYKVKRYDNKWVHLYESKLLAIVGEILTLPDDAKQIPGFNNYFIDKSGKVYSFSVSNPTGIIMKSRVGSSGYPVIGLGKDVTKEVHQLLAKTFIMEDYIKKGFCVLHKDNDKWNCCLDNICVGTYSRNNKDAYSDGINSGNVKGINRSA